MGRMGGLSCSSFRSVLLRINLLRDVFKVIRMEYDLCKATSAVRRRYPVASTALLAVFIFQTDLRVFLFFPAKVFRSPSYKLESSLVRHGSLSMAPMCQ